MPNAITLFQHYTKNLDEVYKLASKTAVLDTNPALITDGQRAGEYVVPKIDMDGLGDYDRNSGYVGGSVTLTNETVKADYDRGRKFTVDAEDDEETAGVAFGVLSSEFIRTKVTPEVDAYRMAKYASLADSPVEAALSTGEEALAAISAANKKMDDLEVPEETRILFITPTLYDAIGDLDTTKSRKAIERFAGRIVKMPQSRFYTAIDLKNGKSDESAGGYAKASLGKAINFMIIEPSAVIQHSTRVVNKVIRPEDNQDADGWQFNFRNYGIADVYENKTAGIYCHHAAS